MKKVLISGKGRVEKVNLLDILNIDSAEKQSQSIVPRTPNEQFRMKAVEQIKSQTSKNVLDLEQERSF
jgi:hypothetical protein